MRTHHLVLAAALASFIALPTFAAEPSLPQTGSAQDIMVPHALPSTAAEVPHGGQHLTSPSGTQANAAERGPVAQNALIGRATERNVVHEVERNRRTSPDMLPLMIDQQIMQDCIDPGANLRPASLPPAPDRALKAILHQVIRHRLIAQPRPGITAQTGDQGLDRGGKRVHLSRAAPARCGPVRHSLPRRPPESAGGPLHCPERSAGSDPMR